MKLCWKVSSLSADIASVRYRALLPIYLLSNHESVLISDAKSIDISEFDAVIFVKSFSPDDYRLAITAHKNNIPIILDLCDNIFIESYGKSQNALPSYIFKRMSYLAAKIIVTTEPLRAVVYDNTLHQDIYIIPDGIDDSKNDELYREIIELSKEKQKLSLKKQATKCVANLWDLVRRLKKSPQKIAGTIHLIKKIYISSSRSIKKIVLYFSDTTAQTNHTNQTYAFTHNNRKKIVWFGNHGAPYASFGMSDILLISESLVNLYKDVEFDLIVVSNDEVKFNSLIKPLPISSIYLSWSKETLEEVLSLADLAIIPNSKDNFSICKSANRAVTCLLNEVPVVANLTPALYALSDFIAKDNFEVGMKQYLCGINLPDWQLVKNTIEKEFGNLAITTNWLNLLSGTLSKKKMKPEIAILVNLIQDIDLALPLINHFLKINKKVIIFCNSNLKEKSPKQLANLEKTNALIAYIDEVIISSESPYPSTVNYVIAISESNLGPHRFSHKLIKIANNHGIMTYTMQHGFENIGLTYNSETHPIEKISFASKKIFIWGPFNTLHPQINPRNKKKCIPVGCLKTHIHSKLNLNEFFKEPRPIVGVFENLHWERYNEEYRNSFISTIQTVSANLPDHFFIIKPHHAGLWISKTNESKKLLAENVIILDPAAPEWQEFTAPSILGSCRAIITTPSTIVIDAALQEIPVAVFGYKISLDYYNPLTIISDAQEASEFILNSKLNILYNQKISDFLKKHTFPGNALENLSKELFKQEMKA